MILDNFIISLYSIGGIKFGQYPTRNNNTHPLYIDLRVCMSYPKIMNMLVDLYSNSLGTNVTCICSVPYGSTHLASCIAYKNNKKIIIPRKNGTLCGKLENDETICFIEDIITTGKSVFNIVGIVDPDNIFPNVLCFLSYYNHENVHSITSLEYILDLLESKNVINSDMNFMINRFFKPVKYQQNNIFPVKNSNLIVALDVDTWDEAKKYIIDLAEYVTAFKFHFDLIDDIDFEELKELHIKYNFAILNDRKYADVPHINQKLNDKIDIPYVFNIVHAISGFNSFPKGPVIIVLEMSNYNTLITSDYRKKVIEHTKDMDNVIGYVSQHKWWDNNKLCFTPGIKNEKDVIDAKDRGTDMIIVGRSIINAVLPNEQAKSFRDWSK